MLLSNQANDQQATYICQSLRASAVAAVLEEETLVHISPFVNRSLATLASSAVILSFEFPSRCGRSLREHSLHLC